jgi:GNAT superfamily N-acetyltransferase
MTQIELRPFLPSDRAWMIHTHIQTYERDEGFDATFGVLIAQILDDFLADHDHEVEQGWIAWDGDTRLGSVFCVKLSAQTAKLRLFQLVPEARGRKLGLRLLEACTDFARDKGYQDMVLATHKSHEAAVALYLRNGWTIVDEKPVVSFGQPLIEQTLTLSL